MLFGMGWWGRTPANVSVILQKCDDEKNQALFKHNVVGSPEVEKVRFD